jgi:hypothetical protein
MNRKSIIYSSILIGILFTTVIVFSSENAIAGSPRLSFYPPHYNFGDKDLDITDSTTLIIWNSGGCYSNCGTLYYTLSENCDWVYINPSSGTSNGENDYIIISIDTTGLSFGPHRCDILIKSNGGNETFVVLVNIISQTNNPPIKPTISGPLKGKPGEVYEYTISSIDPEDDDVYYEIEWFVGCSNIFWDGPYQSGNKIIKTNYWMDEGNHVITVRVKDSNGLEGESATLTVSMPKQKIFNDIPKIILKWYSKFSFLQPYLIS